MKVQAEAREGKASRSALRRLRDSGRVPSVIYGKHAAPKAIHVSKKDVARLMASGQAELLEMDIPGEGVISAMLVEAKRDPISGEWLHADFHQVAMDEPVRTKVPIEIVGTAPGTKAGGLLQIQETHVEIEALPKDLPPHLEADVTKLEVGDKLTAGELTLPKKVKLLSDPKELVLSVIIPRAAREAAEANEAGADDENIQEAG